MVWPTYALWHSAHLTAYITLLSSQVSGLLYLGITIFVLHNLLKIVLVCLRFGQTVYLALLHFFIAKAFGNRLGMTV